ncbi:receptor-interacting serine/threonine-protein kinase 1 [Hypomesus transpacificus]|uniref:receptor-interacting serine/threonine-protein kinase 1 n=1 Tax=Hypomesus transpacificus TaxID=137520 RepID=UPI001F07917F|nr:receptor-interacting serine/threonine-protein kinase 1 [Hypomesus transpacificus]XP_046883206.1 receptor-interacting serine/threonine-protein kinase 1 [Hypomesus transpacificus]XP_046883207.1 receptor-interacting serine/threonine-protein kinase 1 [Hypomesus transpacificus]
MATSLDSIRMQSSDLIKKEHLDYGGFGQVHLCYHKTLGQVVLKTVYTGPPRNEAKFSKKCLLEEGSLMTKLNHERVVKLLGVILDDGDYSLVLELIPKGNLQAMLDQVQVPMSIKGRIILEILEGMEYLSRNHVIHKDLKPENILVDRDFHIKIADLGLATCQTWSRLTKEESRRQSRTKPSAGVRAAGTLCYMAPEHLESVHTPSTERSDVYSFSIVIWVILTRQEPYENARSEDQICQCVRRGDRPDEGFIPPDTLPEMTDLMRRGWSQDPRDRPTFKEGYTSFLPVYREKLEPDVEIDSLALRESYEGPEDLLEMMKSFSLPPDSVTAADLPGRLMSSDVRSPVEASIEDLKEFSLQTDARTPSLTSPPFSPGQVGEWPQKRANWGTDQPDSSPLSPAGYAPATPPQRLMSQEHPDRGWHCPGSTVHSWGKAEPVQPNSQEEPSPHPVFPSSRLYSSLLSNPTPEPFSNPCQYNSQHSWPLENQNSGKSAPLLDTGSMYINNASCIQIGNNNSLKTHSPASLQSNGSTTLFLKEAIQKYEDHAVTEKHLDLLRDHIGAKWKQCARRLGLSDVELEEIDHDYDRDGLSEKVHQMLVRWSMKEGSVGCTLGRLCKALDNIVKVDLLQRLVDVCTSEP